MIFYPINSVKLRRTFPHVSQEVFKLKPCFANPNTSTTILVKVGIVRVKTPGFHVLPRTISQVKCAVLSPSVFKVWLKTRSAVFVFANIIHVPSDNIATLASHINKTAASAILFNDYYLLFFHKLRIWCLKRSVNRG